MIRQPLEDDVADQRPDRRFWMQRHSLNARFAVAAILSTTLALLVAGLALPTLFERHVERRIGAELRAQLDRIVAALVVAPDGRLRVEPRPSDPRFRTPLSGYYWQVDDGARSAQAGEGLLRSRSLWDASLQLPSDPLAPGVVHAHWIAGPAGQQLMVRERSVRIEAAGGSRALRVMVALDRDELLQARRSFTADMLPYLALIAAVLGLAAVVQVRIVLAPLEGIRRGVAAIRSGQATRLQDSKLPDEIQPLATELNALLAARERSVERARAWTADLAHGLKTPLSALAAEAQDLREQGQPALADGLEQLAQSMRRRVDRELVRARLRSGRITAQACADAVVAVHGLLRALRRAPDAEHLRWELDVPATAMVAMPADDLMELLGNLLENAAKWACSRIWVRIEAGDGVRVCVTDDGPGVPESQLDRLGERGLRLDEGKAGSGLGLAIVRDVVNAYGASLTLRSAPGAGLTAEVSLPGAEGARQ
jgi:signal transduction histidine kinase